MAFGGEPQRMCGGSAQRFGSSAYAAKPHAGRVNDVARLQFSPASDGGITDRDASDFVALALDLFAAFAVDRASNARAEDEVVVGGVNDGVHVHFREITLLNSNAVDRRFHRKDSL